MTRANFEGLLEITKSAIANDLERGLSIRRCADRNNVSERTVYRVRLDRGIAPPKPPKRGTWFKLKYPPTEWTPAIDRYIKSNSGKVPLAQMSRLLNIPVNRVAKRAFALEAPDPPRTRSPSKATWIKVANQRAAEDGLDPVALMAGCRQREYSYARWRAFRDLLVLEPRYSLAAIGRVSGFDHTSVRHGLIRLSQIATKSEAAVVAG